MKKRGQSQKIKIEMTTSTKKSLEIKMTKITFHIATFIGISLFLIGLFPVKVMPAATCVGTISKMYVETDDTLFFGVEPSGECGCNYDWGGVKGFFNPPSNTNHNKTYTTVLSALLAGKAVHVWYDWTSGSTNANYCVAYNVKIFK